MINRKSSDKTGEKSPRHNALVGLTTWVRGKNSAMILKKGGRFSIGNTTPEKKNMGERNPVK